MSQRRTEQRYGGNRHNTMLSILTIILGPIMTTGCQVWATDRVDERVMSVTEPRRALRVTRSDNSKVILERATVARDTLFGTAIGKHTTELAIPLRDITKVETRKVTRSSVIATVGLSALAITLVYVITNFSLDTSFFPTAQ